MSPKLREVPPVAIAILVAAVYTAAVLFWPARGVTFLYDDWSLLKNLEGPAPGVWLRPVNQHWAPVFLAALDIEHRLFGGNYALYLATLGVLHVGVVYLLVRVLEERTGDRVAAALAGAAFALTPFAWRDLLWWATGLCVLLCFAFSLAALLAHDRHRREGGRWFLAVLAATVAATLTWGGGFALVPTLALDVALRAPPGKRRRELLALAASGAVLAAAYLAFNRAGAGEKLPRAAAEWQLAQRHFFESLGLGFPHKVALLPLPESPLVGTLLALGWLLAAGVLAVALPRARPLLAVVHVWLACVLGLIALTRWSFLPYPFPSTTQPRYHYFPGLAWTAALALVLARARERWPRATPAAAALVLALLAARHGRAIAEDVSPFAPATRHRLRQPEVVARLVEVARETPGPLFDGRVSRFLAWPDVRVRDVVAIVDARAAARSWTSQLSPESYGPYERDPLLRTNVQPR